MDIQKKMIKVSLPALKETGSIHESSTSIP